MVVPQTMTPEQLAANRLYLAVEDMNETKRYLEAYIDLANNGYSISGDHCNAILQLAVVCYCRCFIRSNTHGKADPNIPVSSVELLKERGDLKTLHRLLLKKRHQLIAHMEWKSHSTELVLIHTEGDCTSILRKSRRYNPCAEIDVEGFIELVTLLELEFAEKQFHLDCKKP